MFFTLPFKRSIAKTSHNQSQQKRRTSPRHSSLCLIQRAISSEWPALRASVFYYTRFGGSVKGVFMEGEEHLCLLCGRNSFILCLQIHNSCIGWNERFPPFFLTWSTFCLLSNGSGFSLYGPCCQSKSLRTHLPPARENVPSSRKCYQIVIKRRVKNL